MIEYCYDAVRLNLPATINAYITDENEELITEGCVLYMYDAEDDLIAEFEGVYDTEFGCWNFYIEGVFAEGRYSYIIKHDEKYLDFKKPLYIM